MNRLSLVYSMLILSFCLHAQNNNRRIVSPEILPDNSVIFRIKAPNASSVAVIGTFALDFKPVSMVKNDSGIYEAKIGPLPSDMYEYRFILDSSMMLDPNNNAVTRDGSIVENRLLIPGKLGDLIAVQDVPHGNVTAVWYRHQPWVQKEECTSTHRRDMKKGRTNILLCIYCTAAAEMKKAGSAAAEPTILSIT